MKAIDGDSHFHGNRWICSSAISTRPFASARLKMVRDPESGKATMLADGKPL